MSLQSIRQFHEDEALALSMAIRWCSRNNLKLVNKVIADFGWRVQSSYSRELFELLTFQKEYASVNFHVQQRYLKILDERHARRNKSTYKYLTRR